MNKEYKEYLDSLPDKFLIAYLLAYYGTREPVWEKCSKEEYEKNCGNPDSYKLTPERLLRFEENLLAGIMYRAVPVYNNGGGILDQISGKKPDGYIYEKSTYFKQILVLGNEMIEYCKTRECTKALL